MNFNRAIVRIPGHNFASGISTSILGPPDFQKTITQHSFYCDALESCGLDLTILEADLRYPDATFVEDVAVVTREFAIITNPGANSRIGETDLIQPVLESFFEQVYKIESPGTLDGGDICQVDDTFLIGISSRTNLSGGEQLAGIVMKHGYTASFIDCRQVPGLLHLKSGIAYLGDKNMVVNGAIKNHQAIAAFETIEVSPGESYAANCVSINEKVLIAAGFPHFQETLEGKGYATVPLEVSEFEKMDGGLSCLSLRF